MKLIWHGHSCFTIQSHDGTLVIDPYENGSVPGFGPLNLTADLVLCSHEHADHNGRKQVQLTHQSHHFNVSAIETYHDDQKGSLRGTNKIHIIETEKMRVVHLGDLGCPLTHEQILILKNCDVLMVPVGGFYTINAKEAYEIIQLLTPRVVIPMHYRTSTTGYDSISTLDEFLKYCYDYHTYEKEITIDASTQSQIAVINLD